MYVCVWERDKKEESEEKGRKGEIKWSWNEAINLRKNSTKVLFHFVDTRVWLLHKSRERVDGSENITQTANAMKIVENFLAIFIGTRKKKWNGTIKRREACVNMTTKMKW